ncbi:IclR family transcriptional regulator [Natrarchaeobius chitinivorans]|uniref:IclR family transcriptional regulator n=1 Tax=Natrarchaeobius chitinivorans TaxID=1679083 RepID=A0A3N6MF83_NATCH|nr:IclR family transcriptional regulator [Natrarchaeobius chitinivorans]RQG94231.1 IclR family transcriptional regulator [Natrarchaeobius chitinivorans]
MEQQSDSGGSIKAVQRTFEIIETLRIHGSLTLTELADALSIPTSTAHVYLQTLEQEGIIVRDDRRYRNGLKFLEYGGEARQQLDLYGSSRQVLSELATQTGERASVGVEENGKRVLLALSDGPNAVSDNIPVGEFTEMHWTSLGKCILAYLPSDRREEILAENPLPRATDETITDEGALRQECERIRSQGYAIENEERREGIRSVSVPILTPEEEILGAIGVTGPTNRFEVETMSRYVSLLEEKANIVKLQTVY